MKVFVAGGTSGIGFEIASIYLKRGHEVAICGRNLAKVEADRSASMHLYEADIYDKTTLASAVGKFANNELDLMIIAAGNYADDSLSSISYEESCRMLQTNIAGVVNAFEVARDAMYQKQKGHIVVLASVSGLLNYTNATTYSKTKRAVIQIAQAYRRALSDFGVKVTIVAPGYVDTFKLRELNNEDLSRKPFVIDASRAAQLIVAGIDSDKELIIFPKKMKYLMLFLASLPRSIQEFIMYRKALWMNKK